METWPNDVRIVFKHNPLGFHKQAMPAAKATMAAHQQGKFWEYHDIAFANAKRLDEASLEGYAEQLGLNMADFRAWRDSQEVLDKILHDQKSMVGHGARGTPASFVNGKHVKGAQPFEKFKAVIEAELAAADAAIAAGTSLADVHRVRAKANGGQSYVDAVIDGKPAPTAPQRPKQANRQPPAPTGPVDVEIHPDDPWKGAKDARVVIAEWSDFQ